MGRRNNQILSSVLSRGKFSNNFLENNLDFHFDFGKFLSGKRRRGLLGFSEIELFTIFRWKFSKKIEQKRNFSDPRKIFVIFPRRFPPSCFLLKETVSRNFFEDFFFFFIVS